MKHLTPNQLYKLIDNNKETDETKEYIAHVEECAVCRNALLRLEKVDNIIKEYPQTKTSYNFSSNLVNLIYEDKKKSFITRFISDKGFYIMGFLLLLIIMNSIMNVSSEIAPDGAPENTSRDIFSNISGTFQQMYNEFSTFLHNLFGQLSPNLGSTIFYAACLILIWGLLDKILFKKFMKTN
jgi:hypothetical protein